MTTLTGLRRMWRDTIATTLLTVGLALYCLWLGVLLAFTDPFVVVNRILPSVAWGVLYLLAAVVMLGSLFWSTTSKVRIYGHGYVTLVLASWAIITDILYPTVISQPGYTLVALLCGVSPFVYEFVDRRYGLKQSTIEAVIELEKADFNPGNIKSQVKWEWDAERQAWITIVGGDVLAAVQGDSEEIRLRFGKGHK